MTDTSVLIAGLFGLSGIGLAATVTLKGWQGWLELKKMELASASGSPRSDMAEPTVAGERIELADLRARVRKLEAIASGIDL